MEVNKLFTELYRPKKFENVILLDRIIQKLGSGLINQNILLHSNSPGTGKTSLVKIFIKGYNTHYMNVSKDGLIENVRYDPASNNIRNKNIELFLRVKSLGQNENTLKIVWLEEFDYGSDKFYATLRGLIEEYANSARFIATCNYINKIPKPLLSRFNVIELSTQNKEEEEELVQKICKRILAISKLHGLIWDKDVLNKFVQGNFPDIRKMISKIQDFVDSGITNVDDISDLDKVSDFSEIFETIVNPNTSSEQIFQLIRGKYTGKGNDVFHSLTHDFPKWLKDKNNKDWLNIRGQTIVNVADWMYKGTMTNDYDTMLIAAIFQCNNLFKQNKK